MGPSNDHILISREKRYGLLRESYSAPNGYVRTEESPLDTAYRVLNEFRLSSSSVTTLGSYRIQVNRGGGFSHIFFAANTSFIDNHVPQLRAGSNLGKKKYIVVSRDELRRILKKGDESVGEIQWAATLGMGLLK